MASKFGAARDRIGVDESTTDRLREIRDECDRGYPPDREVDRSDGHLIE